MGYYYIAEVSKILQIAPNNIYEYQKRGQLSLISSDSLPKGLFDTTNSTNELFIAKRLGLKTPSLDVYLKDNPTPKTKNVLLFDPDNNDNQVFLDRRGFTVKFFKEKAKEIMFEELTAKMVKYN